MWLKIWGGGKDFLPGVHLEEEVDLQLVKPANLMAAL